MGAVLHFARKPDYTQGLITNLKASSQISTLLPSYPKTGTLIVSEHASGLNRKLSSNNPLVQ